jgi:glutaminyl-tRNA synthetase
LTYALMSKRKLRKLVEQNLVHGWDDPRLTTLRGLRRRGYTTAAILDFINRIGVAKNTSWIDFALLESCVREDLNKHSLRRMAVIHPVKVIIDNYPDDQVEELVAVNNPEDTTAGVRKVSFSKTLYIEMDDFREVPPPKYYRLYPGNEVRLRYAYFVKCVDVVKDEDGHIIEIHCTYDPSTKGGDSVDGRKVKSTIHWISVPHAVPAEIRLYERLFNKENPDEGDDFLNFINPASLEIPKVSYVESSLQDSQPGSKFQFERNGYFCTDPDSQPDKLVFNRTVSLKDAWSKLEQKQTK